MLYIYEVMKLVGYLIIKHVIKKHKAQATTRYQNYLHRMKNNKVMRSQSYNVKMVYPPLMCHVGQKHECNLPDPF